MRRKKNRSSGIYLVVALLLVYIIYSRFTTSQITQPISLFPQQEKINETVIEQYIHWWTNEERTEAGLKNFTRVQDLDTLARYHSYNMGNYNFFDHVDHEGLDPTGRAKKLGIRYIVIRGLTIYTGIGENIALTPRALRVVNCSATMNNYEIAKCTMNGWINSPDHYKNIIGDYEEIGLGVYFDVKNSTVYATQNFR